MSACSQQQSSFNINHDDGVDVELESYRQTKPADEAMVPFKHIVMCAVGENMLLATWTSSTSSNDSRNDPHTPLLHKH